MAHSSGHNIEPSRFLVENLGLLPRGKAFDLALGSGRNAVYLARAGFEVEGVDISPRALRAARRLAARHGVKITARKADLEKDFHLKTAAYDLIIGFNYLQRSLFPQVINGLRPLGMVVYETFTIDQPRFGEPKTPAYLLKYNELLDLFRELRCLRYREGVFENGALASIIAQKIR